MSESSSSDKEIEMVPSTDLSGIAESEIQNLENSLGSKHTSYDNEVDDMTKKSHKLQISPRYSTDIENIVTSSSSTKSEAMGANGETHNDVSSYESSSENLRDSDERSSEKSSIENHRSLFEETIEADSPNRDFKTPVSEYHKKSLEKRDTSNNHPSDCRLTPSVDDSFLNNHHSNNPVPALHLAQSPLHSPPQNLQVAHNVFHNPQMLNSPAIHGSHLFGSTGANIHSQNPSSLACHNNPYFNPSHGFSPAEHWFWEQHRQNQQVIFFCNFMRAFLY